MSKTGLPSTTIHQVLTNITFIFFFLLSFSDVTSSLKINRLDVPTSVKNGSFVLMGCNFDLEGEVLYSVRWYKNYIEFYRFLPSNLPSNPGQSMNLSGAPVDVSRSNSTHVYINFTDLDSEGIYTCEVSTEGSFSTRQAGEYMQVYVLPNEKPYIEGITLNKTLDYNGENVNLTCVSGASRPAARISWFINGDTAPSNYLIHHPTQTLINGLQIRRVGITLQIHPDMFKRGILRLRCSATILLSYEFESITLLTHSPFNDVSASDSNIFYSREEIPVQRGPEVPWIVGTKPKYRVGEWLNLNCSTSSNDFSLKWYINGNDAGRGKQTKEFLSHVDDPASGWILGLKLYMHKDYFQLAELRLKCVATYHDIIKEYQTHLNIISRSVNAIEAQSTISSGSRPRLSLVPLLGSLSSIHSWTSSIGFIVILLSSSIVIFWTTYVICPIIHFSPSSYSQLLFPSSCGLSSSSSFPDGSNTVAGSLRTESRNKQQIEKKYKVRCKAMERVKELEEEERVDERQEERKRMEGRQGKEESLKLALRLILEQQKQEPEEEETSNNYLTYPVNLDNLDFLSSTQ